MFKNSNNHNSDDATEKGACNVQNSVVEEDVDVQRTDVNETNIDAEHIVGNKALL